MLHPRTSSIGSTTTLTVILIRSPLAPEGSPPAVARHPSGTTHRYPGVRGNEWRSRVPPVGSLSRLSSLAHYHLASSRSAPSATKKRWSAWLCTAAKCSSVCSKTSASPSESLVCPAIRSPLHVCLLDHSLYKCDVLSGGASPAPALLPIPTVQHSPVQPFAHLCLIVILGS